MKQPDQTDPDSRPDAVNAAEAIRRERDRAQHYLNVAQVILVALDPGGTVTMINRKGCEVLGCEEEEIVGKNWVNYFVPEHVKEDVRTVFARLAHGDLATVEDHENPILTCSGVERIIMWHNSVLTDESGRILGTLNSGQDITERKRAEQALRKAHEELELRVQRRTAELSEVNRQLQEEIAERKLVEQELRQQSTALEAAANGIMILNLDETIAWVNPAFARLTGYSAEEAVGRPTSMLRSGKHTLAFYEDLWTTVKSGRVWHGEIINRRKDGSLYIEDTTIAPVRDEHGEVVSFIEVKQDVTERKEAQEQLARYAEELRKRNREMEDDLNLAGEVQQALLTQTYPTFPPSAAPEDSAIRFNHLYCPSGLVGGDFFEVLALSDWRAGVFICDVMGHGMRAALVTAILRGLTEELTETVGDPGAFLTEINRAFTRIFEPAERGLFTTALYLVVDAGSGDLRFASAGHPAPLHASRERGTVDALGPRDYACGPALGLVERAAYQTHHVALRPRDLVVLFTDGVCEAEGPAREEYGPARLLEAVQRRIHQPPAKIFEEVLAEVRAFMGGADFEDDVCMLGVERADRG